LRAVVLSDKRIIEFLNEAFINTWVLNTDMKRLRDAHGMDSISPLARAIIQGRKQYSPVDCLVISPELELLGRQPVNELASGRRRETKIKSYHAFLVEALAGKHPGLLEDNPMSR
jgi:hypothetical protein